MLVYRDMWNGQKFISIKEVANIYGIISSKEGVWHVACHLIYGTWRNLLTSNQLRHEISTQVGMYNTDSNILPYTTFEVSKALDLAIAKTQM